MASVNHDSDYDNKFFALLLAPLEDDPFPVDSQLPRDL